MLLALSALFACSTPAPQPAPPEPAAPSGLPPLPEPAPVRAVVAGDHPVSLELAFTGVGQLHRGYFSQERPVAALGQALSPCVRGDVVVRTSWQDDIRLGHIALELAPEQLVCAPTATGAGLDLTALEPVGRALAAYRDAIAAAYDFRVASFRGEVRLVRPGDDCLLRLAGQFPPDGSRWYRCITVGGGDVCVEDADGEGLTRLEPAGAADRQAVLSCIAR